MKKETGIILAGGVGLLLGLGIFGVFGVRRYLSRKRREYHDYYHDFHRHFERRFPDDGNHDVEYLAMQ